MRPDPRASSPAAERALDKPTLRQRHRAQRRALSPERRPELDTAAQHALISAPVFAQARTIALYRPFDGEVATAALAAAAGGRQVLYARHSGSSPMAFVAPTGWRSVGRRRLPVPEGPATPLPPDALVVLPAVAIDARGVRLGLGGGHYDRSLCAHRGPKIGLVYTFQCVPSLPQAEWDVPVDAVATDAGLRWFHPEEYPR